jgi:chemotaxis signal transduction protein
VRGLVTTAFDLEERFRSYRRAFDEAFAVAPAETTETYEDLLSIRVRGDAYALRLREVTGLVTSRKIVPLPSRRPELLGVAGNRGVVVTFYSLAVLLGHGSDARSPSWLALAGSEPIALGFEAFESFLRVRSNDIHKSLSSSASAHIGHLARVDNRSIPVIDIQSTLKTLVAQTGPRKES